VIEPHDPQSEQWPVGWPLQTPAPQALPGLFAMTPVELTPTPLGDVLSIACERTATPILIDYGELQRRGIDLSALKVAHPYKKTTWSLALRALLVPQRLNREYWQDEAGRAFVWITPIGQPLRRAEPPPVAPAAARR
jgi:hypothetical protein